MPYERQAGGGRRYRALSLALLLAAALGLAGHTAGAAQGYVYWTNNGPGIASDGTTLGRADNDGSAVTHTLVTGAGSPSGIAVDGGHIYWGDIQHLSIGRANLDGSGSDDNFIPSATVGGGGAIPNGVALDGSYIYWTDSERYIGRAKLDGEEVRPHFIDAGAGSYPAGIAVAGGTIYFTRLEQIMRVAAGGGTPTQLLLLPAQAAPTSLALAAGHLYWSALNLGEPAPSGSIGRASTGGSGVEEKFISNLEYPSGVATDGTDVYWVDHTPGLIGRALIGSSGATNLQPEFAHDAGGPLGVAVDGLIDPTQTNVSCNPGAVLTGSPTSCTATVSDTASSAPATGTVVFSGNGSTFFSGSSSCILTSLPSGGASCVAGAVPLPAGVVPVNVAYGGDAIHNPSNGSTAVCNGNATQCGGALSATAPGAPGGTGAGPGGGNPATLRCTVPKLKGKTLAQARKLLTSAHCALGSIRKGRTGHGHKTTPLVVGSQRPAAGLKTSLGTKVTLALTAKKPSHKAHKRHWALRIATRLLRTPAGG